MKKYLLLKTIRTKDGNMFYARATPYMEGEIPKEFINPLTVMVIDDDTQAVIFKQTSEQPEVRNINQPNETVTTFTPKFLNTEPTVVSKLNINTMSVEQIKEIKGIGEKTATMLATNKPYTDIVNLTNKVKPPTGKSWAEFNFMFVPTA
jgi:hypothetical protein